MKQSVGQLLSFVYRANYPDMPMVGSRWMHRNGNVYQVIAFTNTSKDAVRFKPDEVERYPDMIIYQNVNNGTLWSREVTDWHRSFQQVHT